MKDQSADDVYDDSTLDDISGSRPSVRTQAYQKLLELLIVTSGFGYLLALFKLARSRRGNPFQALTESLDEGLVKIFQNAVIGDSSVKTALAPSVSAHARAYAGIEPWRWIVLQILTIAKYIAFFILINLFQSWAFKYYLFGPPEMRQEFLLNAMRTAYVLLLWLVLFRNLPLAFAVVFVPKSKKAASLVSSLMPKLSAKLPLVMISVYLLFLALLQQRVLSGGLGFGGRTYYLALLFTLTVVVVIRLISAIGQLCSYLFNRFKSYHYADSVIAVHLLSLVELLRVSGEMVSDSRRRRTTIGLLEDIATRFEIFLPKQIVGTNLNSVPLGQELAKIGAGVRALKRQVAIPTSRSWDEKLRQDLSAFLINFLSLNWVALPKAQTEKRTPASVLSQLKGFARTIVTGAIPGILLAILQATPYGLTGQRAEIALLVAVAWFALSIILRLDPEFAAKTKALKDVQDIVTSKIKA